MVFELHLKLARQEGKHQIRITSQLPMELSAKGEGTVDSEVKWKKRTLRDLMWKSKGYELCCTGLKTKHEEEM